MGKKRIIRKAPDASDEHGHLQVARSKATSAKIKVTTGIAHINSTYNNTLITLSDSKGNALFQASSGALGFNGSKKGTPYAASRAADVVSEFALQAGIKELAVRVKGTGSGRESAIRIFVQRGFSIDGIKDLTPIPHGHPRLKKPRRV